jgi:hypothetical protein
LRTGGLRLALNLEFEFIVDQIPDPLLERNNLEMRSSSSCGRGASNHQLISATILRVAENVFRAKPASLCGKQKAPGPKPRGYV